jgi:hypothetical protein
MTLFSSPAYATVLSMEVSFWDKRPLAFYSALASAPLSDDLFALCWDFYWCISPRVKCELRCLSSSLQRGEGKWTSKPNDDTCNTFAVSTLEPSLHKGCNSPSVERLYSPLFVSNPKGTSSCGPLHESVVRWAESGGWFNEGMNVLPRMSDLWSLPCLLFWGSCWRCLLLTLITVGWNYSRLNCG